MRWGGGEGKNWIHRGDGYIQFGVPDNYVGLAARVFSFWESRCGNLPCVAESLHPARLDGRIPKRSLRLARMIAVLLRCDMLIED